MRSEKWIEQKVNDAFNNLENPHYFWGSSKFEARVIAALRRNDSTSVSRYLPRISGWAAAVMVLINIGMFGWQLSNGNFGETGINLFLESYEFLPASSWENYFEVDDINSMDYEYEKR
jgi:hypothetical protein